MKIPRTREEIDQQRQAARERYAGSRGIATYAAGLVLQDGQQVLPAESAVKCSADPSIRQLYNRNPFYSPNSWVGKTG